MAIGLCLLCAQVELAINTATDSQDTIKPRIHFWNWLTTQVALQNEQQNKDQSGSSCHRGLEVTHYNEHKPEATDFRQPLG